MLLSLSTLTVQFDGDGSGVPVFFVLSSFLALTGKGWKGFTVHTCWWTAAAFTFYFREGVCVTSHLISNRCGEYHLTCTWADGTVSECWIVCHSVEIPLRDELSSRLTWKLVLSCHFLMGFRSSCAHANLCTCWTCKRCWNFFQNRLTLRVYELVFALHLHLDTL